MSRTVNRVILVGNAGSDPDVRETSAGTAVAHLSLATNRIYRRNGETQRRTDWHRLTFWRRQAELVGEKVTKGDRLYVEGHLEYGSFERDGIAIPTVDVVVEDLVILEPRERAEA
ncbi:single-stranded DNA-binding protein [Candidatus Palauibacter sp.]|uniref:single-stranded DNA-binding protein n=1 Tax=Candidatus Palauibacter sp. TaxID=3101350 RepID=UPI003B5C9EF1